MNRLMSIAIPTFNRREVLLETLQLLVPQVLPYSIPIYISDNHSSDGTAEAVRQFAQINYGLIFLASNSDNLGFSANIRNVVAMASSKYVWIMSDDDHIVEDAVSKVLSKLTSNISVVLLNASHYNRDFSKLLLERTYYIRDDIEFQPGEHEKLLLSTPPQGMTFIILRSLWAHFSVMTGSESWTHTDIILRSIVGRSALFIADPIVKVRQYNENYSDKKFEIYFLDLPKVIWDLPGAYSQACKKRMVPRYRYRILSEIVIAKSAGWINKRTYDERFGCLDLGGSVIRRNLIPLVVFYLPTSLCRLFAILLRGSIMLYSGELMSFRPRSIISARWAMALSWSFSPKRPGLCSRRQ